MTTLASGPASFSTAASTLFDPLAEVPPDTHGSGWVHDIYATELLRDRRAVPEIENTVLSVISEHIRESAGGDLGRFQLDDPAGGLRVWRLSPAPAGDGVAELVERLLAATSGCSENENSSPLNQTEPCHCSVVLRMLGLYRTPRRSCP